LLLSETGAASECEKGGFWLLAFGFWLLAFSLYDFHTPLAYPEEIKQNVCELTAF